MSDCRFTFRNFRSLSKQDIASSIAHACGASPSGGRLVGVTHICMFALRVGCAWRV